MLTEREREWLEHRDAMQFLTGTYIADFAEYPLWNSGKDWQDAAEFSERVAAKLAKAFKEYVKRRSCVDFEVGTSCPGWEVCAADYKKRLPCDFAIMKGVQLEVEEEMNADEK